MRITALIFSLFITAAAFCQDYNKVDANGLKQGVWKKTYESSQVFRYVGEFKDDKPIGKFVYYYETGEVQAVIMFWADGVTAYSQMYHESGYMMARGKYVNQLKDSTWVQFDDRGIVSYTQDWKAGKKDGLEVVYYEPVNGQYLVSKYANWKNDVLHGEFKTYHPNTQVASEGSYENGNLSGMVVHYHANGRLMRVERYQYAVRHGYWVFYDEEGKQVGYKLFWEGKELKGDALVKKEAELKEKKASGN